MAISSLIPFMHYGLNGSICNEGLFHASLHFSMGSDSLHGIAKVADCGAVGDKEHCLLRVGDEYAGIECLLGLLVERAADLVEEEDIPAVEQPEHHLPDACGDVYRRVPADASRVTP